MTWILIMFFYGHSISQVSFADQKSCEAAKAQLIESEKGWVPIMDCVPYSVDNK